MKRIRIIAIVGSLRKDSYNRKLALAAKRAVGDSAEFELLEFSDVPIFNEDIEFPAPDAVRRIREIVKESDGVWFFTPEYNGSYSGALKNLVDWLSREDEGGHRVLSKKPAAVGGITPGSFGTVKAQEKLVSMLNLLNMRVMNYPKVTIPNAEQQMGEEGTLKLERSLPYVEKQARAFTLFIRL